MDIENNEAADEGPVDIHANQQNDYKRTDHPPELREANRSAISNLLSNTTSTATHVLNIPGTKCTIELTTDSITLVKADAIVNAANEMLEGGGGVDQAIHAVAGSSLRSYCVNLPYQMVEVDGGAIYRGEMARCPVGEAVSTPGFDLPHATWIIHTVAPLLDNDGHPRTELLKKCYRRCLEVASELDGCASIAFCALGTGFYGFPQVEACEVAISTVYEWLLSDERTKRHSSLNTVKFCLYGSNDKETYPIVLGKYC